MMPTGGNHFASMSQQCDIFAVFRHSALLSFTISGQQSDYNQSEKHETNEKYKIKVETPYLLLAWTRDQRNLCSR